MHGPRNRPVQASDAVYGPDFVKTCTDQTPLESGASVLLASRLEPPEPFPLPSPTRFSRFISEPSRASRHLRAIQNLPTATAHRCNEIEARGADKLQAATEYAAAAIARRHGNGEVAAKIRGFMITAPP